MSIVKSEHTITQVMKKISFTFIIALLSSLPLWGQSLSVSFADDSIRVCAFEPVELSVMITGGTAPYSVTWSDGSAGSTIVYVAQTGGVHLVATVTDGSNSIASDSIWIHAHDACVWPGDANGDGVANNYDILPIGIGFGSTGPIRPNAHSQWVAQPADLWHLHTPEGVDLVHSDTDGDGIIEEDDIEVVKGNFLVPQSQPGVSVSLGGTGVPLYVEFPSSSFSPGDTVIAAVMLGTAAIPADSVYGIAFSVTYDGTLFKDSSLIVKYDNSWLGDQGVDLITVDKDFSANSQVDIGMSRSNQLLRNGFGQIATIIVTIDDIAGKTSGIEMVEFGISNISLMTNQGKPIKVTPELSQIGISLSNDIEREVRENWSVYPIPARGYFTVEVNDPSLLQSSTAITIKDMMGREVWSQAVTSMNSKIYTSGLPGGTYLLEINDRLGSVTRLIELE